MQWLRLQWAKLCVVSPFFNNAIAIPYGNFSQRCRDYLHRRPHRSFRLTRRRDYKRSLKLPGYWSFTIEAFRALFRYKKVYGGLVVVYAVLSGVLVGIGSQATFSQLVDVLKSSNFFQGGWGNIGQAGLLFASTVTGSISNPNPTGSQGVFAFLLVLMVWLTTVWLLRMQRAGKNPRLRDGLYNAGSPIIAMMIVAFFGLIQLIPLAIAAFVATSLVGFSGVLAMIIWFLVAALAALSLYWVISTFFAMIIVTLPGMYPWRAIRTAGDLVIGRRLRILLRVMWAMVVIVGVWVIIMVPLIAIDIWIGSVWAPFKAVPIVPLALLLLSTVSLVWLAIYIYQLYRKVVDDDAAPAL